MAVQALFRDDGLVAGICPAGSCGSWLRALMTSADRLPEYSIARFGAIAPWGLSIPGFARFVIITQHLACLLAELHTRHSDQQQRNGQPARNSDCAAQQCLATEEQAEQAAH